MQRGIVGLRCVYTLESSLIGGSARAEGLQDGQRWAALCRDQQADLGAVGQYNEMRTSLSGFWGGGQQGGVPHPAASGRQVSPQKERHRTR